jgi:hypothetical protein
LNVAGLQATIAEIDSCVMIKKEEKKGALSDGHGGEGADTSAKRMQARWRTYFDARA